MPREATGARRAERILRCGGVVAPADVPGRRLRPDMYIGRGNKESDWRPRDVRSPQPGQASHRGEG